MDHIGWGSLHRSRAHNAQNRDSRGSSSTKPARKRRSADEEMSSTIASTAIATSSSKRKGKGRAIDADATPSTHCTSTGSNNARPAKPQHVKYSSSEGPVEQPLLIDAVRVKRHKHRRPRPLSDDIDVDYDEPKEPVASELEKLKKEMEGLRKQLQESKKTIRKQGKVIEQLSEEKESRTSELDKLKAQSAKNNEMLTTVESQLSCLICMETLLRPFALPPCGHVYCQSCLQDWFRYAPPGEDDMLDDDDEDALLHRRKTCPTCRSDVRTRPIPVFLIKSLSGAFVKFRAAESSVKAISPPPSPEDPWEGIFYPEDWDSDSSDDEMDETDDDDGDTGEDEDEEDEEEDEDAYEDADVASIYGYGTGSDEDPYEGNYIDAQWAPPSVSLNPAIYDPETLSVNEVSLLRRGATLPMIETYHMRYAHETGIRATYRTLDGRRHTFFLGWNITLHPQDPSGHDYMEWVWQDVMNREDRWYVAEGDDGTLTASRYVREDDVDEEGYVTSDTDAYIDDNESDGDN